MVETELMEGGHVERSGHGWEMLIKYTDWFICLIFFSCIVTQHWML